MSNTATMGQAPEKFALSLCHIPDDYSIFATHLPIGDY